MGAEYSMGVVSFFDDTATPVQTHIKSTSVDYTTNAEVTGDDSGGLYEEQLSLTGFSPVATVTSKAVKTILTNIPLYGQCVGPTFAVTVVDVIARRLATCVDDPGSTPHMRYRCENGLLRLTTLSADRNEDMELSFILDTFTDSTGANAPVEETDGVAMPTPTVSERYRLGLCTIAGIAFPDIEGITIEYNLAITEKTPALGNIWPEQVGVLTVRPVLVMRGRDLSKVQDGLIQLGANAVLHADSILQFIKLEDGASFEDFGDSEHITMTLNGLAVPDTLLSVTTGSRATNEIRIPLTYDGTNLPIVVDLASTYTP